MDIGCLYQRSVTRYRIHQLRRGQWADQQKNSEILGVAYPTNSAGKGRNIDPTLQSIDPIL
jgi:trehalose/maltose hydrolase-like predicted phosphorylase